LTNDTFTGNTASGGSGSGKLEGRAGQGLGGAVFLHNGTLNATFVTFSSNTAANGGTDLYLLSDTSQLGTAATLVDDILGQTDSSVTDFVSSTIGGGSTPSFTGSSHDLVRSGGAALGTAVISTDDPLLGQLASNGGPTQTMALMSGSPAIDAGVAVAGITTDQAGNNRPTPPSLGALEFFVPTVTSVSTSAPSGIYRFGAVFTILVNFSSAVNVSGTPLLLLNSGGTAYYSSGSGSSTLVFTYTVGLGQHSTALSYANSSALRLNGGSITLAGLGAGSTQANLTLPQLLSPGSLSYHKSIVVNTGGLLWW
jgi:hypothetical protein